MADGNKCLEVLDKYWTQLESIGLVDSFSSYVDENGYASVGATYVDENGNGICIELHMTPEDLAENNI